MRPMIDGERLWETLMTMAKIGAIPNNGNCRLSLSDEDKSARDFFVEWCLQAGCDIHTDPFGNIFAVRAGKDQSRPLVLMGSHLDTQPTGGRFDGILGVLAGLEVIRSLNDANIVTEAPVAIVNWTNEEGVRFSPGLTGSKAFAGELSPEAALDIVGVDGLTFGSELKRIGYAGDPLPSTLRIGSYLELHIEQGPILERAGKSIGVVEGVQGVRWYTIELTGRNAHAGTTPMAGRQDCFMAASRLSLDLRDAALALDEEIRLTVGRLSVEPGSPNTVPGRTTLTIDLRHRSEAILDAMESIIDEKVADQLKFEGVQGTVRRTMTVPPTLFDEERVTLLCKAATEAGMPFERMFSGAMHDASAISFVIPSAMIFVPCRDGISHNEAEWVEPAHASDGCEVLARAVLALAAETRR